MYSSYEAFTTEWIKHKLQEQLKDEIIVTEINGKPNVVTFRMITAKILQNFYNKRKKKGMNNFSCSKIIEN